jgi:Putative DNA-binding domain
MDVTEIEKLVASYIEHSQEGLEKEHPKFDFKREWYDLKSDKGLSEFIKDTTAMANTVGLDGFIVIGFDDETKAFHQATFRDSRLGDTSELIGLVNKKVDTLFDLNTFDIMVDGHKLSVIHIPPSINKPHVIKLHKTYDNGGALRKEEENRVLVRKGTATRSASKYDFELMYYDRKNITPDYELHSSFASQFSVNILDRLQLRIPLTIENTGRRPVAMREISLTIEFGSGPSLEKILMISEPIYKRANIIIDSGKIWNDLVEFLGNSTMTFPDQADLNAKRSYYHHERPNMKYSNLNIVLANGTNLNSELVRV